MPQRWTTRPEGSNWGDFGPDDQKGTLNYITSDRRKAASQEVKEGLAFSLSLPLDMSLEGIQPSFRHPPVLRETAGHNSAFADIYGVEGVSDIGCDDSVLLNLQYSTQWDALSHVGSMFDAFGNGKTEPVYYNGFKGGVDIVNSAGNGGAPEPNALA